MVFDSRFEPAIVGSNLPFDIPFWLVPRRGVCDKKRPTNSGRQTDLDPPRVSGRGARFYCEHTETGRQESLKTWVKAEALRLIAAKTNPRRHHFLT
jgi:hypothetical protein